MPQRLAKLPVDNLIEKIISEAEILFMSEAMISARGSKLEGRAQDAERVNPAGARPDSARSEWGPLQVSCRHSNPSSFK